MSKFTSNLTRDLMRFVAVSASAYKHKIQAQIRYENMKARMEKYIYVPAEKMTTEQIIEDYENWGQEVIVNGDSYIIRKNMMVVYRASSEKEFRDNYAAVFSVVKLC